MNSNQSQSKPKMDTLIKNSKRKILKLLRKFEDREAQGYGQEDTKVILESIIDINSKLRKFENDVEKIQNYIIYEWEEEDEEKVEKEIEKLTKESIKYFDYVWEYTIKSRQIIYHIESSNKFNLTNILDKSTGKETAHENKFNKFTNTFNNNNDNNGTNAKIEELPELNDESEHNNILEILPENSADTHIAAHDPSAVLTNITVTDTQNRDSQNQITSVLNKVQNNTQTH